MTRLLQHGCRVVAAVQAASSHTSPGGLPGAAAGSRGDETRRLEKPEFISAAAGIPVTHVMTYVSSLNARMNTRSWHSRMLRPALPPTCPGSKGPAASRPCEH